LFHVDVEFSLSYCDDNDNQHETQHMLVVVVVFIIIIIIITITTTQTDRLGYLPKGEFIIQVLNFLIIFHQMLKTLLVILRDIK
jgi:hypothetical protein